MQEIQNLPKITFVLGNESADLDSCFGSIGLAMLRHIECNSESSIEKLFIPVINCSRQSMKYKFELLYILKKNQIDQSNLIFENDLSFLGSSGQNYHTLFNVILYDHNLLSNHQKHLKPSITEVIDHHEDKTSTLYDPNQLKFKDIRLIGSATSIVTQYYMRKFSQNNQTEL